MSEPRADIDTARYVVGAMMTPSHAHFGERLAVSCRAHSLPLALIAVPSVHRSISKDGSDDLRLTKANFVQFLMDRYRCPILYVDADCVIAEPPTHIDELLATQVDFAIFNWLAEEHTEAYIPAKITVQDERGQRMICDRYYSIFAQHRCHESNAAPVQRRSAVFPARGPPTSTDSSAYSESAAAHLMRAHA